MKRATMIRKTFACSVLAAMLLSGPAQAVTNEDFAAWLDQAEQDAAFRLATLAYVQATIATHGVYCRPNLAAQSPAAEPAKTLDSLRLYFRSAQSAELWQSDRHEDAVSYILGWMRDTILKTNKGEEDCRSRIEWLIEDAAG